MLYIYNKQVIIKLNNLFICSRSLVDNLYRVSPLFVFSSNESYYVSSKRNEPSTSTNQT